MFKQIGQRAFLAASRSTTAPTNTSARFLANSSLDLERITVKCPPFADSISEGDVSLKLEVGAVIKEDDIPLEIETDKTAIQAPSPVGGVLVEILVEDGDTVEAGADLYIIDTEAVGSATAETAAPAAAAPAPVAAAPVAAAPVAAAPKAAAPAAPKATAASPKTPPPAVAQMSAPLGDRTETRVKMNRMRQRISQRLKDSQNTAASLTTFNEIDMTNIMALRNKYKEPFQKKHGIKLGFMSAFAKASANALVNAPSVNGVIDDVTGEIVFRNYVDISVAVATPKGLVVPVLRNVEKMNYFDIEHGITELGTRAREGQLSVEEMDGGTFTISNGGVFKSLFGTPIINQPQSAILGMHGVFDRPMAINGKVEIRPMMYVALTYDHRIVDGRDGVTFLRNIKECVEEPAQLLMNL
jgi:2-oxoglutarate dehydrogenase E2 component (dihydrolipoamide succinyltransferase)